MSLSPVIKNDQKLKIKILKSSDNGFQAVAGPMSSRSLTKKSVKINAAINYSKSNKGVSPLKASMASSIHSRKAHNADLNQELSDNINILQS